MKFGSIKDYKGGWIAGDFDPSIVRTSLLDLGVLYCPKGHIGDGHYHKLHTEYNIVVTGKVKVENMLLGPGDIFIYEPYDRSYVEYLEDSSIVVLKYPATKNDKYL